MHQAADPLNSEHTLSYPEIMGNGGWGVLCYTNPPLVSTLVGEVICRQTQSLFLERVSRGDYPHGYSENVFYSGTINCTGDESLLSECEVDLKPSGWCPGEYTTVSCTDGEAASSY